MWQSAFQTSLRMWLNNSQSRLPLRLIPCCGCVQILLRWEEILEGDSEVSNSPTISPNSWPRLLGLGVPKRQGPWQICTLRVCWWKHVSFCWRGILLTFFHLFRVLVWTHWIHIGCPPATSFSQSDAFERQEGIITCMRVLVVHPVYTLWHSMHFEGCFFWLI